MWRPLRMVLMAVMKQHVSTKGLGFQELSFFLGFFTLVKNFRKTWGFFMFCHLLDRSFDWVDSCMFRSILKSVMVLRTHSWWAKKNEEKPRIQQRFFSFVPWGHWEKSQPSTPPEDVPFFGGVKIYIEFVGNKTYYWGASRGRYQLGNVSPKHASSVRPTQWLSCGWKCDGLPKGEPETPAEVGFGLGSRINPLVIWATINKNH